jgi:hypothetical protein
LFRSRVEKKLAHLARRIAGDGALARPRQRLVHIGGFQYPETADESLVSVYGPSVTSTVPSGCFRTVFALPAGEIPQANFLTPAAINSRLSAWISSIIASVSTDGS